MSLMDFMSESTKLTQTKKAIGKETIDNPVLCKEGTEILYTILVDRYYTHKQVYKLQEVLDSRGIKNNYQIICPLTFKPTNKDLSKEVVKLYSKNIIDLKQYIPEWSKVITIGRTLYSITHSDALKVDGFYDLLLNQTSFFDPYLKCQIFPIDDTIKWFLKETVENEFANLQFDNIQYFQLRKHRMSSKQKVYLKFNEIESFLKHWIDKDVHMAWDIETNGLDPCKKGAKIIDFTCAFDVNIAYHMNWFDIEDIELFSKFLKGKLGILANAKFDAKWMHLLHNIPIQNMFFHWDTVNISKKINELQNNSLKSDAWIYTKNGGYDKELDDYKEKFPACKSDYSKIPNRIRKPYACDDVTTAFEVYLKQQQHIDMLDRAYPLQNGWSLRRCIEEIVMPSINEYFVIEMTGLYINKEMLFSREYIIKEQIKEAENKVYEILQLDPKTFNLNSPEQLGKFVKTIGWQPIELSKKGIPLTNNDFLKLWAKNENYKGVQELISLREKQAMHKSFIGSPKSKFDFESYFNGENDEGDIEKKDKGMYQYIVDTGLEKAYRVYPTFIVMMANSLRNRSRQPNAQNFPAHGEKATFIKKMFCPPSEEYMFLSADYSGLQARIATILSKDSALWEVFTKLSGDLHSITGCSVLGKGMSVEEFFERLKNGDATVELMRRKAKGINFSLLFGASAFSFAKFLEKEWTIEEIEEYILENNLERSWIALHGKLSSNSIGSLFDSVDDPLRFAHYWAVAKHIRDKYFETYSGLKEWIDNRVIYAMNYGYARSVHGPFRRLPKLKLYTKGVKVFDLNHYDNYCIINQGELKNMQNIAINSPVQTFEAIIVNRWANLLGKKFRELSMLSQVFINVHDSLEFYIHKDELQIACSLIKKLGEESYPEYCGLKLELEGNVSDYYGTYSIDENNKDFEVLDAGHDWSVYFK